METEEPRPVEDTPVTPDPAQAAQPTDLAPDADEPGDDLPDELVDLPHEGDVQPDEVDQKDVAE